MKTGNFPFFDGFNKEDKLLIAVSGGADSMALLDMARKASSKIGFNISAAHLNHGIREDSDEDEELVRNYCKEYGINFYSQRIDLKNCEIANISLEEAGREARYSFFKDLIEKYSFTALLTAHHLDDQAETILMRLTRGTGPYGLCGIREKRDFYGTDLFRPFLSISKVDLIDYCNKEKIPYKTDPTNKDSKYTRNAIRNEILPQLEEISPKASKNIANFASLQTKEQTFLNNIIKNFADLSIKETDLGLQITGSLFENIESFLEENHLEYLEEESVEFLKLELIRYALNKLDALKNVSNEHLKIILDFFETSKSGSIDLPNNVRAIKSSGIYEIIKNSPEFENKKINQTICFNEDQTFCLNSEDVSVNIRPVHSVKKTGISAERVYLRLNPKNEEYTLRRREPGDRVYLKGMDGSKKLSRFFIDKKIPKRERDNLILLARGEEIIWIPGYYIHRDYQIKDGDNSIFEIELKKQL